MAAGGGNNLGNERNRADVNRARKIIAVRELQRLLEEAIDPKFTGNVAVEIAAKQGRLNTPKTRREQWPED